MADTPPLARVPKMDRVLAASALVGLPWRREIVRLAAERELDDLRARVRAGQASDVPDVDAIAGAVRRKLDALFAVHPQRVINATGVLLHTNLGRAPLGPAAIAAAVQAAGYCDLEVELDSGRRGSRFAWIRPLLASVTFAPDAHVVNNNAAALLLACTVLGQAGGVVLSHGQMVEIGDGFRVATMAAAGGCRIVAVGSTNRTHLADYEGALAGEQPASAILWVHLSNFSQSGFVSEVPLVELAKLARARGVPLIADLGSGSLGANLPAREPTVREYLDHGADLVLASGDKLLGGPQAGIIAGRAELVEKLRRHPMARALRPDKVTLAALHATLVEHAKDGVPALPLHRMVAASVDELRARARAVAARLALPESAPNTEVVDCDATIGGGSLPGDRMDGVAVRIVVANAAAFAKRLRTGTPPVVGRIENDAFLLDLRTVDPEDDGVLADAVARALADVAGARR
jgi:L-seryl-tRNA(Ser) seleniumtransferase